MVLHKERPLGGPPRTIADGDLVILYEQFDSMKAVYVDAKENIQSRFGCFPMKDWVGKPFGSRMCAKGKSQGWVHILAPTPELWTQVLRHRTQILYAADIAMICTFLELRPGCTVLESGTGSGSLTHSLARAVAPSGHVHTFDFHQKRTEEASAEFARHGLGPVVTVQHRNIEALGFPKELHGKADALFLDLPGPWNVVESAAACLRPDGVFCSFSPCIEQVQRTCTALAAAGFTAPRTMECLLRAYEVNSQRMVCDLDKADAAAAVAAESKKRKRDGSSGASEGRQNGGVVHAGDGKEPFVAVYPTAETRGHTGYLTFARRLVDPIGEAGNEDALSVKAEPLMAVQE
ncbi:tRNA (adenine(58)-N(1))-methyltransferase catalytic subunit [Coccomyxa sp. Obi]|nr:tRNA (adenine(58)-N(1))-methyltransferase catalytic subunit [Coccomyxa sp. Obi]